jgi:O-antigen ligase
LLWIAWLWIGIGVLTACWVLAEDTIRAWWPQWCWIHPNLSDWRGYLAAGLGNTSHIGDLLALLLLPTLILFGEARTRPAKIFLFAAALLLPAGLIVAYSVGSNFGLLTGAAVMLIMVLRHDRGRWFLRRKLRWAILLAAWIALILFFVLDHPANPHRPGILKQGFSSERWKEGAPTRLVIWAQGLEMIHQHPLRGVGTGNFPYLFPQMDSELIWDRPDLRIYQGLYTNAAHNELLQSWAELGIVGLFCFIALAILAYYSLLQDLSLADRSSFLIRTTLAGLLTAWLAQAQMNFCYQHPAGALTFYTLLLAVIIENRTRPGYPAMPSLQLESGIFALQVEWRQMSKPTAAGLALVLPRSIAVGLGLSLLILIGGWIPHFWRPVLAQREYQQGMRAELRADPQEAERHFRRALALDVNATGCRSHYCQWLIDQGRPQEGLEQLKLVRQRLNSNELWTRQAQALFALGKDSEAQQALKIFHQRVWRSRGIKG